MKEFLKLKIYYIFYRFLILIIFLLGIKFIYDFSLMNHSVDISNNSDIKYDKFVLNPRVRIEDDGFDYIQADRGYLNEDNYVFENVNMSGDFGDITSGRLDIKDNKNILEFTINPKFIIYIDNLQ